ncbi:60S ribosomal L37a [Micractinium conductrix]|uniref:60S ribosomal L37a n=1 Tax=Micractinium conductrix TaxID=554055 RepID=A0A2P6VC42_9CHLO|nr:60S ribosomal L37a [Micractinium conductrix]|eukprot:PSC71657.1 60S ribosomal L37a [Micractinium conductrix]
MSKRTKKVGIVGKYGTRYGASLRKQIKKIEVSQHSKYFCSFCGKFGMKRQVVGIWKCKACNKTQAGGAYVLNTAASVTVRSTIRRLREQIENPSASLGLQLSLGEPSGRLSASLSRAGSLAARVAGGTGLRSSPTQELWRTSTAVSDLVASALGCVDVADLCGPSYVHPGRLKKIKALGEGAFAEVEKAQLLRRRESPAAAAPGARPRRSPFISEARLLIKMEHHPSIIGYIGLGCEDASTPEAQWRTLYLVQELAAGGTLKNLILNQMINPTRKLYSLGGAVRWGAQIAEGLAHLHSINPMIIHRDLKAENVLLAPADDGTLNARLADFGLHALVPQPGMASSQWGLCELKEEGSTHGGPVFGPGGMRLRAESSHSVGSPKSASTSPEKNRQAGESAAARALLAEDEGTAGAADGGGDNEGSPRGKKYRMTGKTGAFVYMAPEVLLCRAYNEKVDVFSFGVILYELLHRRMIVAELMYLGNVEDAEAHAWQVAGGHRPTISPDLPQQLQALVAECWAQGPDDRPSMADVARRLREVEQSGEVAAAEHRHGPSAGCCTVM